MVAFAGSGDGEKGDQHQSACQNSGLKHVT